MNKTVTINISGIIFHIEEDAYDKLSKYLNKIKGYFSGNESGNEIIADIEARIAELLQVKITPYKQVVLMADVEEVMSALGKPEDFAMDDDANAGHDHHQQNTQQTEPIKKRLYRDPDEKAIGGVCSGIAHYFDVDVVWIRLATFLLIFFGGISLWVYIILWIVIPEAKTTADRLAMRGERVTIDNISKSIKEEMHGVKSRMEKYGNDVSDSVKHAGAYSRTAGERIAYLLGRIFMIVGRLIGAFFVFLAVMVMIGLMSAMFGFTLADNNASFNDWINTIFINRAHYWAGMIGLFITVAVPTFMLLYGGIKLLFKIKYSNRWLNISAGLVWLIGFLMALYTGVKTGYEFSESGKVKDVQQLAIAAPVYTISASQLDKAIILKNTLEDNEDMDDLDEFVQKSDYHLLNENNRLIIAGKPKLDIVASSNDAVEIVVTKKARGNEKREAYNRAGNIDYIYKADSAQAIFNNVFVTKANEKFRVQEVQITVKVPVGKTIYLDKTLDGIIYDVDNVTNTYDKDMLERKWSMTDRGLECVDCEGIETNDGKSKVMPNVRINEKGIHIQDEGTKIEIDERGININSDNKDVKLKKRNKNKEE
jgi:phage shock protein PspC (stress-responsive transcriptional regulator)